METTGAKVEAIRERFDLSPTRYYQLLSAAIDTSEALAIDPLTVNRLLRIRENRRIAQNPKR
ncbi:DUF3263 domain-containing protein [Mycobacteroides stephanolepidis]|uniref:DUF3263 domain-containing protein n=1 Tax=[Mycobacterium] stephanolepidis TaxID=1520670 RepID=UPI001E43BA5D|nr:DUF3263 domain-containing protein [[Mycobacterium] stephanolepidis]